MTFPLQGQANGPLPVDLVPQEESVLARPTAPRGKAADLDAFGEGVVQAQEEVLGRKAEGVHQEDEPGVVLGGHVEGVLPGVGAGVQVGQVVAAEMKGGQLHVGKARRGQGHPVPLLDLPASADDPAGGAAQEQGGPQVLTDHGGHGLVLGGEMARHEDQRQVRGAFAQGAADLGGALPQRLLQVLLLGYR